MQRFPLHAFFQYDLQEPAAACAADKTPVNQVVRGIENQIDQRIG